MPVVSFPPSRLRELLGKRLSVKEMGEVLPKLGGDLDRATESEIAIEYFPDRSDLVSVEGIARALRSYLGITPGIASYKVAKARTHLVADPRGNPRPHIVMAYARGADIDEESLEWLIGLQEKLDQGVGRRRKRVAIGVHDAAPVKGPFTYKAVAPRSVRFVPLQHAEEMDLADILDRHPKGQAFAHLLSGAKRYPLITDANGHVLSFPPVINGTLTAVRPGTRDLLIDMTGPEPEPLKWALAILLAALADRGARLEAVTVRPTVGRGFTTPDLAPQKGTLDLDSCNRLLGTDLKPADVKRLLERMGHDVQLPAAKGGRSAKSATRGTPGRLRVLSPAWRADILHEWDLVEDVAKAYGYMEFEPELPTSTTFGAPLASHDVVNAVRASLLGLGFCETMGFTLTSERDQFERMGREPTVVTRLANPVTEDHTILRPSLVPGLLRLLTANKHRDLPQALFEVGWRVRGDEGHRNRMTAAAVRIGARESFSAAKGVALALARDLGLGRESEGIQVRPEEDGAFVQGRCAALLASDVRLGVFGELHPRTLLAFELGHPVIAMELDLEPVGYRA